MNIYHFSIRGTLLPGIAAGFQKPPVPFKKKSEAPVIQTQPCQQNERLSFSIKYTLYIYESATKHKNVAHHLVI